MESYMLTEETGVSSEFNRVLILVCRLPDGAELAFESLLEINECYAWLHMAVYVPIFCLHCFCNIQMDCSSVVNMEANKPCRLVNICSAEAQKDSELIRI